MLRLPKRFCLQTELEEVRRIRDLNCIHKKIILVMKLLRDVTKLSVIWFCYSKWIRGLKVPIAHKSLLWKNCTCNIVKEKENEVNCGYDHSLLFEIIQVQ